MSKPVWLVTGTSSGIGLSLVKELISQGYRVAGTSRNLERLVQAVGTNKNDHFLPLQVDITNEESIEKAVNETISYFGTIDVLVNNAGHGFRAVTEETTPQEARQLFEDNFFSAFVMIRHVLPIMRAKRSGYIYNVGSIAADHPLPLSPFYAATKSALTSMSISLQAEVEGLGIKVTPVEPGPFNTKFFDPSNIVAKQNTIPDYKEVYEARAKRGSGVKISGDPDRAAKILIEITTLKDFPRILYIGSEGLKMIAGQKKLMNDEIEKWRPYTERCDYPNE